MPLQDAEHNEILMHRDVHFGGKFPLMIQHYEAKRKGVQPHFDLDKLYFLAEWEKTMKQNPAPLLLTAEEIEKVAKAKKAYEKLQEVYEKKGHEIDQMIADLILSEEDDPEKERAQILGQGKRLVPELIALLRNDELHDPLFPGFGLAPLEAAKCLGTIGDDRALISLFEEIDQGDFFDADAVIQAFGAIGQPAKVFLLKFIGAKPINADNEKAAIAIAAFKQDIAVLQKALVLLQDKEVQKAYPFSGYLALLFDESTLFREEYRSLAQTAGLPSLLRSDMEIVIRAWKEPML